MTDTEDRIETELSPSGQDVDDEPLAPPGGYCEACGDWNVGGTGIQSMKKLLQFYMRTADDLHDCLVNGQGHLEREALAAAVPCLLYMCQNYFNHVESTERGMMPQNTPLPFNISTRLQDFSQQLCDRLEQLVLTYASYGLLSLDETDPNSASHFCIGQFKLGRLRLTVFRYCKPTPYLARVDTSLYKRMRWNVDRLRDEQQQTDEEQSGESEKAETKTVGDTDYYFLCYEDIPNAHAENEGDVVRMWTIGRWVQVNPDPDSEDICDWYTDLHVFIQFSVDAFSQMSGKRIPSLGTSHSSHEILNSSMCETVRHLTATFLNISQERLS
uniref:Uncharacterized protein n=1 Tax=Monopterus albus TaxID=43700 RepID=A0A3Q3KEP6_MONAL